MAEDVQAVSAVTPETETPAAAAPAAAAAEQTAAPAAGPAPIVAGEEPAVQAAEPAAAEPEKQAAAPAEEAGSGPVAEAAAAPAETTPAAEPAAAPRARRARIQAEAVAVDADEEPVMESQVDFSDEEAELAARSAGLELGEETDEEAAAGLNAAPAEDRFAGKSKEELVALFARMLEEQPVQSLRREVEALKIAFYRLRRAEVEAARRRFIEEGGNEEEFTPAVDGAEVQLKELFREYRRRRDIFIANLEAEKEANYKIKLGIIEELKELVNSDETINNTFTKFRELQQRWKETGIVPQQYVKDLWETYNLHVENF